MLDRAAATLRKSKLLHELCRLLRSRHYNPRSERTYCEAAIRPAGLPMRVICDTLSRAFATHVLEDGYDIRSVQVLLPHKDVKTTMVYTHVLNRGGNAVRSHSTADGRPVGVLCRNHIRHHDEPKGVVSRCQQNT